MRLFGQVADISETYCDSRQDAAAWLCYSIAVHKLLGILLSKDAHSTGVGCDMNMVFSWIGKFLPTSLA
ncbi:MAG: hypothetical protein DMG90_02375 [Acidobacteria bacterium]|nr:MAG: hypothetical protein DMG90_02375 [Acidobacteriota bacterium]